MPIKVDIVWQGVTEEQYEQIVQGLDYENTPLDGHIMHLGGHAGTTLRTTDTWVTQKDFDEFFKSKLMPIVRSLKIDSTPEVYISNLVAWTKLEFSQD